MFGTHCSFVTSSAQTPMAEAWGRFKTRLAQSVTDLADYGQIKAPAQEILMRRLPTGGPRNTTGNRIPEVVAKRTPSIRHERPHRGHDQAHHGSVEAD